jgi:hypothetical protein
VFSCTGSGKVEFGTTIDVFRPEWWATNTIPGTTSMTAAFTAAIAAAHSRGGGVIKAPGIYNISEITISDPHIMIDGATDGYTYQDVKSTGVLSCTTGVWAVRFALGSSYSGLRNIALVSNGELNSSPPHVVITDGVEYGILIENGSTIIDSVAVSKFQYGCVIASSGNSNIFDRSSFTWCTRAGFAVTPGNAGAYAAYHPNLTPTSSLNVTTIYTMRNCIIRRNGWGMILRDGAGTYYNQLVESNYFGGLCAYKGSLDSGTSGTWYNCYFEANWLLYDKDAAYTITQNNLLKETDLTWMPWTLNTDTALNDAGYQILIAGAPGTASGPTHFKFYSPSVVNGSAGATSGKAFYIKQAYELDIFGGGSSGGDQPNSIRLGGGTGGFFATGVVFHNFIGTLPTSWGNRCYSLTSDLSGYGGLKIRGDTAVAIDAPIGIFGTVINGTTQRKSGATISNVSTTATICTLGSSGYPLGVIYVQGGMVGGGAMFIEQVICMASLTPKVLGTVTLQGSPTARTYTMSGNDLQLAMAADSYNIRVSQMEMSP